jgi:hypothetical protein
MSKCQSGERRIDVVELLAICDAMGVEPHNFIELLSRKLKSRIGAS